MLPKLNIVNQSHYSKLYLIRD